MQRLLVSKEDSIKIESVVDGSWETGYLCERGLLKLLNIYYVYEGEAFHFNYKVLCNGQIKVQYT